MREWCNNTPQEGRNMAEAAASTIAMNSAVGHADIRLADKGLSSFGLFLILPRGLVL
jgi:hypothetical protein